MFSRNPRLIHERRKANGRHQRARALLVFAGLFVTAWSASARDSTLIEPGAPIAPVLIVANYSFGVCSQSLSGNVLSRLVSRPGPEPVALTQNPQFIMCRLLPKAIAFNLEQRGVNVALREFLLPERIAAADYSPKETEFQQRELSAPENASRYALVYTGVSFENNLHILGFLSVLGPMDAATGKRPDLGRFLLNENVMLVGMNGQPAVSVVPGITYHLQSPLAAGAIIANSLEARCTKTGILNFDKCPDRLHLQAPN